MANDRRSLSGAARGLAGLPAADPAAASLRSPSSARCCTGSSSSRVRDGFPAWRAQPAGLAAIMIAATVALGTALLLAGLAPSCGPGSASLSPIGLSAPIRLVWLLVLLLILALSLLQTAALHTALVGAGCSACWPARSISAPWEGNRAGDRDALIDLMIIAAALAVLVGLTVLRARRAFSWWEFVVVLVVLTAATVLPTADALVLGLASDAGSYLDFAWNLLVSVGFLAAPIVLAAGYAIAAVRLYRCGLGRRRGPRRRAAVGAAGDPDRGGRLADLRRGPRLVGHPAALRAADLDRTRAVDHLLDRLDRAGHRGRPGPGRRDLAGASGPGPAAGAGADRGAAHPGPVAAAAGSVATRLPGPVARRCRAARSGRGCPGGGRGAARGRRTAERSPGPTSAWPC